MKSFWLIFTVYLLLLSWQPCEDLVGNGFQSNQPEINLTDSHESHEQTHSDDCSPLCICSCCQITFVSADFNFDKFQNKSIKFSTNKIINYQNPYQQNFAQTIWQPPKSKA
ncbi:MAG: hypothetical protein MUC29_04900 [Pyrinomonadaceae bacterium]|jgi:hypothetical protein|nr:hypothetical protein [Pyrinomonadaceae bacterium]